MKPLLDQASQLSPAWRTLVFLALIIFIVVHFTTVGKRSYQPISWPILGMFPWFLSVIKGDFHETVTHLLHHHNGTFTFKGPWFGGLDHVVTSDPSNLEHMLKTNFSNFRKGQSTKEIAHDLLGDSLFTLDDMLWRSYRKIVARKLQSPLFNKTAMECWVELIHSRLFPVFENFIKQSVALDLQDVLSRLVFDHSCSIVFGVDPGCLTYGLPDIQFAKAYKSAAELMARRFYLPILVWKLMRYLNLGWEREMKRSIEQIDEFAYKVITERRIELSKETSKDKSRSDLLSLLMETKDDNENYLTDNFLRDMSFDLMFAGTDTIPVALSWFFWLIYQNPNVEEEIYREICYINGKEKGREMFRVEEVKKMNYLQAALTEALRLYPPAPCNRLEVHGDDQFSNGLKLKKGNSVLYSLYAMGRTESIWGQDCREFKPERWMRGGEFVAESPYKFPAFNAGPRSCVGKDLAYCQMKTVAASIIHRYRLTLVENHLVVPKLSITLNMKYGLKVIPRRRDEPKSSYY